MVSLINFKVFDEELQQQQQKQQQQQHQHQDVLQSSGHAPIVARKHGRNSSGPNEQDSSGAANSTMFITKLLHHDQHQHQKATANSYSPQVIIADRHQQVTTKTTDDGFNGVAQSQQLELSTGHGLKNSSQAQQQQQQQAQSLNPAQNPIHRSIAFMPPFGAQQPSAPGVLALVEPNRPVEESSFVVTWRKLSFAIEPKWHERVTRVDAKSSLQVGAPVSPASKVVLDQLDGSFRSGELTAILGPSGSGKTTLLDCLTGHKKKGLSGSIRISGNGHNRVHSEASHGACCKNNGYSSSSDHHSKQQQLSFAIHPRVAADPHKGSTEGGNLKVSIIPQNDHLMGHLTVYETLNYASKMKNCFDREFDHKLNIKSVAQQLGLMSCLDTRINKLSGGQYKRVSIAQELLSSPDILILDEPTSGLDAMTCFQTVQVLRRLIDDRQLNGQKQIAVILTIHQPNSDVFQQFNHVYVVAQGGKCIFEGPPESIESVINRIGIRLPNSFYNPATMIVEIAAGKFGSDSIHKLNSMQRKQHEFVVPDEQNSTGDSAVDCPSSSSNDEDESGSGSSVMAPGDHRQALADQDTNNNNNNHSGASFASKLNGNSNGNNNNARANAHVGSGLVNRGFLMDNENNEGGKDVIVVVQKSMSNEDADSVDKIKMINHMGELGTDFEGRRKKRRRTRRRSGDQQGGAPIAGVHQGPADANGGPVDQGADLRKRGDFERHNLVCASPFAPLPSGAAAGGGGAGGGGGPGGGKPGGGGPTAGHGQGREKRLKLNSLKADQKFPFWRHTYLHFHRSWLSIVRDPMLCSMQLALHILVPLMVGLVYGTSVGKPNACPRAGPMDIMAYAIEPKDSALQLQEDLRRTLENIGYIFFKLYGIIFAAMTVTVLTFPLDMHVLVKEFRNGWYGLSSYFLGRTLADIPFQLTLPLLAMSLSYYATGQPSSYMQWRFFSITAILILSSLIAQSQGLLFGAILMDRMKAAVFVAPAATTPIILFAGFLVRTQSIPRYLRPLSNLSYLRYAIEACLISRYGFNQCECDPAVFNQTVPELPPIARSMLDYWLSSFKATATSESSPLLAGEAGLNETITEAMAVETTTLATTGENNPDLFTKLIDSLAKANSFGRNITSCEQVVPYPMIDYDLKDSQLVHCFGVLLFMLIFTRVLTFFIVCFKVKRKV